MAYIKLNFNQVEEVSRLLKQIEEDFQRVARGLEAATQNGPPSVSEEARALGRTAARLGGDAGEMRLAIRYGLEQYRRTEYSLCLLALEIPDALTLQGKQGV